MKAKLIFVSFFAVVALLAIPAYSQDFLKRTKPWLYPDDSLDALGARRMQPTALPFGSKNFENKRTSLFSKLSSPSGETQISSDSVQALWVRHYASGLVPSYDRATAIAVDGSGNVYVTGSSIGSDNSYDYATAKYNASGVQQWMARYNGPENDNDYATALAVDAVGNVYVTGSSGSPYTPLDYATIKYNVSGVEQWAVRYNGPANERDEAVALTVDAAGNVYVTGYSWGSTSSEDYATIKYNSSGVAQWVVRYNGPGNNADQPTALAVDAAGNVYVTGYSYGSTSTGDYATIKYNASGAAQWVARYNGPGNEHDEATALAVDAVGNVHVTGYSRGSDTFLDYATIKYNASGGIQWVARYNGPGNNADQPTALAVDPTGNVYMTGYSWGSTSSEDYATIKYNAFGVEQWVARYNGPGNSSDRATALAVDTAGNVYVTGYSWYPIPSDYATIKYDAFGVEQWVARYNGPGNEHDEATALAVDAVGNVHVTGYSEGSGTENDYATIKYNASGVEQWVARYNGPGHSDDEATALAVDTVGNVYVTGYSEGSGTEDDYATIKYNASGVAQWVARYNGPGDWQDQAAALAVDARSDVYVTGYSWSSYTDIDYATIKYNTSGVVQWETRYNGPLDSSDVATALAVDAAGNVYVTGFSWGSGTSYDYATIKYNTSGVEQWVARYNGPGNERDEATALAVDAVGNVYVTGYSRGSGITDDYATIKYNASGVAQWVARYNGKAVALAVDPAGNVYVTGYSGGYATIKYNASGVEQWVARYNGPGNSGDVATALAVDAVGNVYVTGSSAASATDNDYATIKYSASGAIEWVTRYNGSGNSHDYATALAVDAAGNVYVTGYSWGSVTDYATIKYNASGVEQWVARYNGPGDSNDYAAALVVDVAGKVYVTGSSSTPATGRSVYTTIQYPQTVTLLKAKTTAATNVTVNSVTLNGTVNPNGFNMKVKFAYGITRSYGDTVAASPGMVSGADDILVSANLDGLSLNTTYHFHVFAASSTGLIEGEDRIFKTLSCEAATTVSHTPPAFPQPVNNSIKLNANVLSVCGVDSVVLKYRRGGDAHFRIAEKFDSADSLVWVIPDSAVTARGVEYFVTVKFLSGEAPIRLPFSGVYSLPIAIAQGLRKSEEQPPGSEQNAYRLISMPLDLDDKSAKAVLEDDLGQYDKKKWRLFSLRSVRPDSQAYVEYSDTLKMDPGKAFMLIVKDAGRFIDTGVGTSNRTDKPFSIVLHPRWNFVGNPFNFPIPLENLSVKSGKPFPLRYHEGTWRDPFLNEISEIKPFEGYAIFNTLKVVDTLLINPDLSLSASSLAKGFASIIEEKIVWSIRILAQCQDALDEDNRVAIVSGASTGWDEFDQPEPPVIGEYVSVYFPHPEWGKLAKTYCTDVRPMTSDDRLRTSDGEVWPFEVKTNIRDKVNLAFEGLDDVPPELEVWLVDDTLKITQNLREQWQYAVAGAVAVAAHPKQLKLVVGKRGFVDEKLMEARAIPTTYELSQNFPNPFNPATTIRYGLPKAERVTLKIYNLLGAEVATLVNDEQKVAGYHAAVWDGRDKASRVVASGVYVYRMRAGSFVMTKKLALVK